MTPIRFEKTVTRITGRSICDILSEETGLPKSRIKHAMACGAVWRQKPNGKKQRLRRAAGSARLNDRFFLYYSSDILDMTAPSATCVKDFDVYSVWYKPPGLMSQGTLYGDHCSLLRQVEKHAAPRRKTFLIHRLDREAAGLMVLAHSKKAASLLSNLFRTRQVTKQYQVDVLGDLSDYARTGTISTPLDGKTAVTHYEVTQYTKNTNRSNVTVRLETGRRHQIRRHFESIGFPVIGDPRYGRGNKNETGMHLVAETLSFVCPFKGIPIEVSIEPEKQLR